jgi:hypothetical protein
VIVVVALFNEEEVPTIASEAFANLETLDVHMQTSVRMLLSHFG